MFLTQEGKKAFLNQVSAVCFTGPRPTKLPHKGKGTSPEVIEIRRGLEHAVRHYINEGKTIFLNGGMAGFDVMAGEVVLQLKEEYPDVICVTVFPFCINLFRGQNWTSEWILRAIDLCQRSDLAFGLSETYHKNVYYERDEYLVNHSSVVICYYNGKGGGTKYTINYANHRNVPIYNLTF